MVSFFVCAVLVLACTSNLASGKLERISDLKGGDLSVVQQWRSLEGKPLQTVEKEVMVDAS